MLDGQADKLKELFGLNVLLNSKPMEAPIKQSGYWCNHEQFLLKIKGVASYEVCAKKNTIFIGIDPTLHEHRLILTWLNGIVLAYLLQYHGFLILHGSAIVVNQKAIVFCGNSGIGKSTLAATLNQKGYPFLTDDLSVIRINEHSIELIPMPTGTKLWRDALAYLGKSTIGLRAVINRPEKFEMPIENTWNEPIEIARLYELTISEEINAIKERQMTGMEQVKTLLRNTYRYELLKPLGKLGEHLQQVKQMANCVPCYQLTRPSHFFCIEDLIALIE